MANQDNKQKISITINKEVLDLANNMLANGKFRNRSHIFEYSLRKFLEDENE